MAVSCKFIEPKERKKVVIVGGGFAGSMLASKIESDFDVTLIDPRPYTEYTPSILRALVETSHSKKIKLQHSSYLKNSKICLDEASDIQFNPNQVITPSSGTIDFDYLVLCTGSSSRTVLSGPKIYHGYTLQSLLLSKQDLVKAKRVLILGGGTVGVELAGEILDKYPQKTVIIAQSGPLLNRFPPAAGEYAAKQLKKRGVILLNERIVAQSQVGVFKTQSGEEISADIAYSCVGGVPNSGFLRSKFKEFLDDSGYARANEYLQFEANPNVFVAGDLLSVDEEKLAQASQNSATVVAQNLWRKEAGRQLVKYPYLNNTKGLRKLPVVISLGKYDGIFVWQGVAPFPLYEGSVLTGFPTSLAKELVEWKWKFTFPS